VCQAWKLQSPHSHVNNKDHLFPEGDVEDASNYCRNPDNEVGGLWCYTTDPATRWEYCNVSLCGS